MFGKAVFLGVWVAAIEAYSSYKKRRRTNGITLHYDPKRSIYYDPIIRMEKRIKIALWAIAIPFAVYTAFVALVILSQPLSEALAG